MHPVVVHNMLMIGPPGAGKTLLARTISDPVRNETIGPKRLAEALQYRPSGMMG